MCRPASSSSSKRCSQCSLVDVCVQVVCEWLRARLALGLIFHCLVALLNGATAGCEYSLMCCVVLCRMGVGVPWCADCSRYCLFPFVGFSSVSSSLLYRSHSESVCGAFITGCGCKSGLVDCVVASECSSSCFVSWCRRQLHNLEVVWLVSAGGQGAHGRLPL